MKVEDSAEENFNMKGLVKHYYYFAGQKSLWDQQSKGQVMNQRKSIKLSDIGALADLQQSKPTKSSDKQPSKAAMRKSQLMQLEDEEPEQRVESMQTGGSLISPLKELLLEKKLNVVNVRKVLVGLGDGVSQWIDASLDSTPPPMPSPLISAVAGVDPKMVELLIEFKADVRLQYPGKSMLKGWIKPNTNLVECVRGRRARFVGTMLGEKLSTIELMIVQAAAALDGMAGSRSGSKEDADDDNSDNELQFEEVPEIDIQPATNRQSRKSVHKSTRGLMEHTLCHPGARYELVNNFCTGSLSSVREACHIETGQAYCLKAGNKTYDLGGRDPEADLWNEIGILRKLDHQNIMRLFETFEDDSHIYMVFELCSGGDLFDRLLEEGSFSEKTAMRLAYQMASGIQHLHGLRVCHRDIQPESFVLTNRGPSEGNSVKIVSMTTSKEFGSSPLLTKVFTLHYVAPEMLSADAKNGYTQSIDIWSLGVLTYVMIAGIPPFNSDSDLLTLQAVMAGNYNYEPADRWTGVKPDTKGLINAMLVVDPAQRLKIKEVIQQPAMQAAFADGAMDVGEKQNTVARSEADKEKDKNPLRTAFTMLAEMISNEQLEELRNLFKEMDTKRCGTIDFEAIRGWLIRMVTVEFKEHESRVELQDLLVAATGKVNYAMYLATMTDWRRNIRKEAARAIYSSLDIDKNGNISLYEIAQALTKPCPDLATKKGVCLNEASQLWEEMKSVFNGKEICDKEMSFDEFFKELPKSMVDLVDHI
jgi:calcium-dependent protein kinase